VDYEEIREHLERQLNEARAAHEQDQKAESRHALNAARERYERFALHGMIPEDLSEEPPTD
jgi:F0F1-type ATP synthase membrane subunit b/b'